MNEFKAVTTTVAGSDQLEPTDGVGLAAAFACPVAMAYSPAVRDLSYRDCIR